MHGIMKILERIKDPNYMIEDFLFCSGYGRKSQVSSYDTF
jgi:hypothetical protein